MVHLCHSLLGGIGVGGTNTPRCPQSIHAIFVDRANHFASKLRAMEEGAEVRGAAGLACMCVSRCADECCVHTCMHVLVVWLCVCMRCRVAMHPALGTPPPIHRSPHPLCGHTSMSLPAAPPAHPAHPSHPGHHWSVRVWVLLQRPRGYTQQRAVRACPPPALSLHWSLAKPDSDLHSTFALSVST